MTGRQRGAFSACTHPHDYQDEKDLPQIEKGIAYIKRRMEKRNEDQATRECTHNTEDQTIHQGEPPFRERTRQRIRNKREHGSKMEGPRKH
jgi:hypothetical protein